MNATLPLWAQIIEALLLLASAALVLAASWALARMDDFFQRLHPPALGYTLGAWCVCLACIVHFAALDGELQWRFLIIAMLLAITAPITSMLLARAALFRGRRSAARRKLPPALHPKAASEPATKAPVPAPESKAAPAQQEAAEVASSENESTSPAPHAA
ncbi:MAG: monovalent cation/H(+) antiporter subunit G [Ottowia sp.]|nr:monovalent cation/H(+) antiporter subunit G [Ottowia sp.]MBQ9578179.1 monovalent cation/H(+) antiporter subunit G [Ottowia sp.]